MLAQGPPNCVPTTIVINLDQYQSETSWDIKDTNGTTYAFGGNYNAQPDYATVVVPVQIPKGPLVFTIYDTYGDGLAGSLWGGQDGSYYLTQCGDTLVHAALASELDQAKKCLKNSLVINYLIIF